MPEVNLSLSEVYFGQTLADGSINPFESQNFDVEIWCKDSKEMPVRTQRLLLGSCSAFMANYLSTRDQLDEVIILHMPDFEVDEVERFIEDAQMLFNESSEVGLHVSSGFNIFFSF